MTTVPFVPHPPCTVDGITWTNVRPGRWVTETIAGTWYLRQVPYAPPEEGLVWVLDGPGIGPGGAPLLDATAFLVALVHATDRVRGMESVTRAETVAASSDAPEADSR
jgi:hypothetical protein